MPDDDLKLSVDITADLSKLDAGLAQAQAKVQAAGARMQGVLGGGGGGGGYSAYSPISGSHPYPGQGPTGGAGFAALGGMMQPRGTAFGNFVPGVGNAFGAPSPALNAGGGNMGGGFGGGFNPGGMGGQGNAFGGFNALPGNANFTPPTLGAWGRFNAATGGRFAGYMGAAGAIGAATAFASAEGQGMGIMASVVNAVMAPTENQRWSYLAQAQRGYEGLISSVPLIGGAALSKSRGAMDLARSFGAPIIDPIASDSAANIARRTFFDVKTMGGGYFGGMAALNNEQTLLNEDVYARAKAGADPKLLMDYQAAKELDLSIRGRNLILNRNSEMLGITGSTKSNVLRSVGQGLAADVNDIRTDFTQQINTARTQGRNGLGDQEKVDALTAQMNSALVSRIMSAQQPGVEVSVMGTSVGAGTPRVGIASPAYVNYLTNLIPQIGRN